jgi:hypothetical protein
MEEIRNEHISVGKPGRPKHKRENNIKTRVKGIMCDEMD